MTCEFCERQEQEYEVKLPVDGITEETTVETCSACTQLLVSDDQSVQVTSLTKQSL